MMEDWLPWRDSFVIHILSVEALTDNEKCCGSCQAVDNAIYRCLDCFYTGLFCQDCCLKDHARHPFHRISQWNGHYFKPATLQDIGYIMHLGHGGLPCPMSEDHPKSAVVFMDVGLIHTHTVAWCRCPDAHPRPIQLLRMRQYPGSVKSPRTAFTFRGLDYFHMDSVECNTTVESFCRKQQRLTNGYHPNEIPVSIIVLRIINNH
jgi:hypothetical protein